jgi:hypothetical protein
MWGAGCRVCRQEIKMMVDDVKKTFSEREKPRRLVVVIKKIRRFLLFSSFDTLKILLYSSTLN